MAVGVDGGRVEGTKVLWDLVGLLLVGVAVGRGRRQECEEAVGQLMGAAIGLAASVFYGACVVPRLVLLNELWGWVLAVAGQAALFVPVLYGSLVGGRALRGRVVLTGAWRPVVGMVFGLISGCAVAVWLGVVVASVPMLQRAGGPSLLAGAGHVLLRLVRWCDHLRRLLW